MLDFHHDDRLDTKASPTANSHRGRRNHLAGQAAEEAILRHYLGRGAHLLAQRWRSAAGEIDLIFRDGPSYVFVEVKAAASWDAALARITPHQIKRIHRSAEQFVARTPEGAFADMRFDAALCDRQGRVDVLEGVLLGY